MRTGSTGIRGKVLAGAVVLALAAVGAGAGASAGAAGRGSGAPPAGGAPTRIVPVLDRAHRGRDALAHLESAGKVAAVAAQVGWSSEKLRGMLGSDESLIVQPDGSLMYSEATAVGGAGVAAASPTYTATELAQTFTLQSDPASHKVMYLDFVGFDDVTYDISTHTNVPVTYTAFDVDGNLPCPVGTADPACFTTAELTMIRDTWARVAAAYAPFDVNVTTQDPGRAAIINSCWGTIFTTCTSPNDPDFGAHLSFTDAQPANDICQAGTLYSGCGHLGWFDGHVRTTGIRNEVAGYVLPGNLARSAPLSGYSLGLTAVHELGHVLGLGHAMDGGSCPVAGTCYSNGSYGGPDHLTEGVMWPSMRVGSNGAPLHLFTPWGEGSMAGASVAEDVFARMEEPEKLSAGTSPSSGIYPMGILARPDEPSPVVEPNADFVASGVITPSRSSVIYTVNVSMPSADPSLVRPTDQDSFRFTVPAGAAGTSISVTPAAHSSLDVGATLYDASMTPVATSDPAAVRVDNDTATGLDASINAVLAPGDYTLVVDGVGSPGVDNSLAGSAWSAYWRPADFPTYTCPSCGAADYGSIGGYTVAVDTTFPTGVSVGGGSVVEGDTGKPRTITFPVVLPAPSSTPVTVGYSIEADGSSRAASGCATATACSSGGGDFRTKTGTVTFTPSATTGVTPTVKYVNALVYPDAQTEGDETFRVVLSNPVGMGLGRPVGIGTIVDDDPAGATPTVAVGDASVPEGNSAVKVTTSNTGKVWVTLSQPATGTVTVQVTVTPNGATPGTDFKYGSLKSVFPVTKTVTFAAGQWQKPVAIGVFPDTVVEGDETVTLTLSNPSAGLVLGRSAGTFRILDDD